MNNRHYTALEDQYLIQFYVSNMFWHMIAGRETGGKAFKGAANFVGFIGESRIVVGCSISLPLLNLSAKLTNSLFRL
jgi:hypothetical protein